MQLMIRSLVTKPDYYLTLTPIESQYTRQWNQSVDSNVILSTEAILLAAEIIWAVAKTITFDKIELEPLQNYLVKSILREIS